MFSRGNQKGNPAEAIVISELRRLHDVFTDEFRAGMEHLKQSAKRSLEAIEKESGASDQLAETIAARADQINRITADISRLEARLLSVESALANLRAEKLEHALKGTSECQHQ